MLSALLEQGARACQQRGDLASADLPGLRGQLLAPWPDQLTAPTTSRRALESADHPLH